MRVVSDKRRDAEVMRQGEAVKTGEVKGNSLDVRGQLLAVGCLSVSGEGGKPVEEEIIH